MRSSLTVAMAVALMLTCAAACTADRFAVCQIGDMACPVGEEPPNAQPVAGPRFSVLDGFEHPNIPRFEAFLKAHDIGVAGCEMIVDTEGVAWAYDVNTNTNYNALAEQQAGYAGSARAGMRGLARYLGDRLELIA